MAAKRTPLPGECPNFPSTRRPGTSRHSPLRRRLRKPRQPITTPTPTSHTRRAGRPRKPEHRSETSKLPPRLQPRHETSLSLTTTRRPYATETWVIPSYRHVEAMDRVLHETYAKALGLTFKGRQHRYIDDLQIRAASAPNGSTFLLHIRNKCLRHLPRLMNKAFSYVYPSTPPSRTGSRTYATTSSASATHQARRYMSLRPWTRRPPATKT